ncbi:MAG: hypothetical protein WDN06_16960 [Asticcacaulis sp.]
MTPDQVVHFSYSRGRQELHGHGDQPLSKFSWWRRLAPGLFSYGGNGGHVDVDWVRVTHKGR